MLDSRAPLRCGAVLLALLFLCFGQGARADTNDGIFPPAAAAKSFVDFDGRGFLIGGKRTFIASGSMHYSRVPRELWRDRLMRIKRAGFNTVQTYAFWNYHEPQEGKWDFSGDHDLDAYLKLIHEVGLYAVVRPGPYVCAEWDSGGYPVWLRFKPGMKVRVVDPVFQAAVDRWYEKVMPIIAANQINRGGAVIMVQLENEHPLGWGTQMPNAYFTHLRDKAVSLGLEVPYFFSGLHHGADPAGNKDWDSKGRVNPWYTTEFWPGWYNRYGPLDPDAERKYERGTWKIIAYGGSGYNFYMLHGGTNFDYFNDDEVASNYDYGAAIGQAGDLRPIYYAFKNANWFARSFADVLEDSENATEQNQGLATERALRITARHSTAGTIAFLDNPGDTAVSTQVKTKLGPPAPAAGGMTVAPGEIVPIVLDYGLWPGAVIEVAATHILRLSSDGSHTTLVVFGASGEKGELRLNLNTADASGAGRHSIALKYPDAGVDRQVIQSPGHELDVLSVSRDSAAHTWFTDVAGKEYVVSGPDYVGDAVADGDGIRFDAETAFAKNDRSQAIVSFVVAAGSEPHIALVTAGAAHRPDDPAWSPPVLGPWQVRSGDTEAQPDYFASAWKFSIEPQPMGSDGDTGAYAWYRANVTVPKAGSYTLQLADAGDWVDAFVNGVRVDSTKVKQRNYNPEPRELTVPMKAGDNNIALLAAHYGRQKLFNYLGALDAIDLKGVSGPVKLSREPARRAEITTWRWRVADKSDGILKEAPTGVDTSTADWHDASIGLDVFHDRIGFAWFRTNLPDLPGPLRSLRFTSVDDNATVFVNGHLLVHHTGYNTPFEAMIGSAWREGGPNELAVLVENTSGLGGITGPVVLETDPGGMFVKGWRMRGGLGDIAGTDKDWHLLPLTAPVAPAPTFYRATFDYPAPPEGVRPIIRLSLEKLSRGVVWLNGHNLGRYPEKVYVDGIYLPECWLKPTGNTIELFDEDGAPPTLVKLLVEQAASRVDQQVK